MKNEELRMKNDELRSKNYFVELSEKGGVNVRVVMFR